MAEVGEEHLNSIRSFPSKGSEHLCQAAAEEQEELPATQNCFHFHTRGLTWARQPCRRSLRTAVSAAGSWPWPPAGTRRAAAGPAAGPCGTPHPCDKHGSGTSPACHTAPAPPLHHTTTPALLPHFSTQPNNYFICAVLHSAEVFIIDLHPFIKWQQLCRRKWVLNSSSTTDHDLIPPKIF